MVKLEGGIGRVDIVNYLVRHDIPLCGHIGLLPQSVKEPGGYKVQGRDADSARRLLQSARDLEAAGVFAIVLECIPAQLSEAITRMISIPTIGIGAGKHCDGQVLVTHDMLGMFEKFIPSFVKQFANLAPQIKEAVETLFDVNVERVNVMNQPAKRSRRMRNRRLLNRKPMYKKAVVRLQAGDTIDIFEGVQ